MNKRCLLFSIVSCTIFLTVCLAQAAHPGLVIKGKVIDQNGMQAIQGAFVEIENASGGSGYSRIYTNEKGEFLFEDLPNGVSFNLYVEKEDYTSYRRLYWYVDKNKEMESIVVKISKEAIFKCRITTSDKTTQLKRARVSMKPMRWRSDPHAVYEFERETGDDGVVQIDRIPAGSYELTIEKSGYISEKLTNIAFVSGKKREMAVALYRPASISGRVLLVDKKTTLAGIPVISRGPSAGTSTSNFKGLYVLRDLKPGTYSFTANRSGFLPYAYTGEVHVKEGEDIQEIDHYLAAEEEKVKIAIYQEVYPIKKEVKFTVRAFRSEDFELEFYRIPIDWYLKNTHAFKNLLVRNSSLESFDRVYSVKYGFKRYRPYRWFTKEVKADRQFSSGIYLIRALTAHAEDRNFIFVSNIGVIAKRGKGSLLAYAVNFETNQPEKGVDLFIMKGSPPKKDAQKSLFQRILGLFRNDQIILKGKTDADGVFKSDQNIPHSDLLVVGLKPDQGMGISESYLSPVARTRGAKNYVYTDRPVYRPGHRVFFKGILRMDDGSSLIIRNNYEARIQIKDPRGNGVKTLQETTDGMGTVNGSFDLASDSLLGRYTIWVSDGGHHSQVAYFFVQAYRKPDFKVEVKTQKMAYVTDETIKCRIQAAYFFGSPLSTVSVSYRAYQKMTHKPYYRYWWEGEYYRREGYQSLIKAGKAKTDAQGFVGIDILPQPKSYDRMITIEAEVTAPSGRKVSGRKSVIYNQSLYQIEVTGPGFIHKLDKPLTFRVSIKDINGDPVKTRFSAALEQEIWNPVRNRYEKPMSPLYEEAFETDEGGSALIEIPLSELQQGYTRFIISAVDPKENRAVKSASLWLYDSLQGDFNYNYAGLEIWLDKENYKVGDSAKLLINTPVEKGVVLFTMEGQDVLKHEVIPMPNRTRILEIPVKKTFSPNVHLSVMQHDGNRLYHKKVSLNVAVEGREMSIETRFDKTEYRPGDRAVLSIRASDHEGRPVQGDFSVGVVDEAIYYIRPDHTAPIHTYFYAKRSSWISTTYSFPIRYLGGAVKDAGTRIIRKDFKDTAFWLPNLSTNAEGKGSAEIRIPDNLTTWVATIRGHSADNIFGEKKEKCLVTKPLVTSLKLPRFFIRGDRTEIRVVNYNRTVNPLDEVKNDLRVESPLSLLDSPILMTQIPGQGTGQLAWRVEAGKGPEKSKVTIRTEAGTLFDGEQQTVSIHSKGLPRVYDFSGRTLNNQAQIDIPLPAGHALDRTTIALDFTPHPALAGLTALDYLTHFPYGCVEQTLNSFIPMVSYYKALERIGFRYEDMQKVKRRIEKGLDKLAGFQRADGAFGWWRGSEADLYMTSLVLGGVSKVRDVYPKKAEKIISGAVKYLKRQIGKARVMDVLAFGLNALSEAGYHQKVLARTLRSNIHNMDALLLSLTVPVLAYHGMMDDAGKASLRLLEQVEKTTDGSFFPVPQTYMNNTTIETTAFALMALLKVYPEHPEIDRIMKWLVTQKTGKYWVSTKTTGVVISALSEYLRVKQGAIPFVDQNIHISLNDQEAIEFNLKKADYLKGKGWSLSLPASSLIYGTNTLSIQGEQDIYYAMRVESFRESDRIEPASQNCGMPLSKKAFAVTRIHDSRGNPRLLSRPLEEKERLRVGEEIKIELSFTPDKDYEYVVLEDGLPSGFEVVDFEKGAGMTWWEPSSHKERRDENVLFFFDRLIKGREVTIGYLLRSELKGAFHLPPARLFGMYRPSINTHSSSGRLLVGDF